MQYLASEVIALFGQKYSSYNLAIMLGIIFAILAFYKWEKAIPSTEKDTMISIVGVDLVVGFFSAFLGNKLLHFQTWEAFREHFFEFTGMTFLCGLIGSILFFAAVYYMVYRDWEKLYRTLNSITPYFILAQIWGRIGYQRICLGILLIMMVLLCQRKRCGRHYI